MHPYDLFSLWKMCKTTLCLKLIVTKNVLITETLHE